MEYSNRKKKTKREEFLDAMEEIIPWSYWVEMIRPYYFANKRGRKPIGIETMLRMYLMQIWFNLSDEGIEDSIYDSYAMRSFMHIDFNEQQVPDATTLLKFRHMLEANKLGEKIFADVNNRATMHHKTGFIQTIGDIRKNFLAKLICFKHMSELKQGSCIRYLLFMEIDMHKGTHGVTVVDRILDSFIGQIKPNLHEIHTKHGFNTNRFAAALVSEIIGANHFYPV